jgi:hypothetical protein
MKCSVMPLSSEALVRQPAKAPASVTTLRPNQLPICQAPRNSA